MLQTRKCPAPEPLQRSDAAVLVRGHLQRSRCKTHDDTQFGLTHLVVFQQLRAKGLCMSHDLVVLSKKKKMVVTRAAYECAPASFCSCSVRETYHGYQSIACACPRESDVTRYLLSCCLYPSSCCCSHAINMLKATLDISKTDRVWLNTKAYGVVAAVWGTLPMRTVLECVFPLHLFEEHSP